MDFLALNTPNVKNQSRSPSRSPKPFSTSDRFVPNRNDLDMDYSYHLLSSQKSVNDTKSTVSIQVNSVKQDMLLNEYTSNRRIQENIINVKSAAKLQNTPFKEKIKYLYHFNLSPTTVLDAPYVNNDFYLSLIDWSTDNVLAVGLGAEIYLYHHVKRTTAKLDYHLSYPLSNMQAYTTCLKWNPDKNILAIGQSDNTFGIWDVETNKLICHIKSHASQIHSMDWQTSNVITSGDHEGYIFNHDLRIEPKKVSEFRFHYLDVCGLKWHRNKRWLASGSDDMNVVVWDDAMNNKPFRVFQEHVAAVKAINWCTWKSNMLATGSGKLDGTIKIWNLEKSESLKTIRTDCQVSSVLWLRDSKLLIGSYEENISAWEYSRLEEAGNLGGSHKHKERILSMVSSELDLVATIGADESIHVWDCFQKKTQNDRFAYNLTPISTKALSKFTSIR